MFKTRTSTALITCISHVLYPSDQNNILKYYVKTTLGHQNFVIYTHKDLLSPTSFWDKVEEEEDNRSLSSLKINESQEICVF